MSHLFFLNGLLAADKILFFFLFFFYGTIKRINFVTTNKQQQTFMRDKKCSHSCSRAVHTAFRDDEVARHVCEHSTLIDSDGHDNLNDFDWVFFFGKLFHCQSWLLMFTTSIIDGSLESNNSNDSPGFLLSEMNWTVFILFLITRLSSLSLLKMHKQTRREATTKNRYFYNFLLEMIFFHCWFLRPVWNLFSLLFYFISLFCLFTKI